MDEQNMNQMIAQNPGMTSLEAAAMYLSGGETRDPNLAVTAYANAPDTPMIGQQALVLDREQRNQLRELMGFDFNIKQAERKIHVYSKQGPKLSTHCKYDGTITEKTVDNLVEACLRLRLKWEAARTKEIGEIR